MTQEQQPTTNQIDIDLEDVDTSTLPELGNIPIDMDVSLDGAVNTTEETLNTSPLPTQTPPPQQNLSVQERFLQARAKLERGELTPKPIEQPVQEEQGLFDTITDKVKGVANVAGDMAVGASAGIYEAGNEVLELSAKTGLFMTELVSKGWDNTKWDNLTDEERKQFFFFDPMHAETTAGKFTEEITKFTTSFVGVGKFMKAGNILQGASKLTGASKAGYVIGKDMVQGGITDTFLIDAQEERLSDLVQSIPALRNPITEYLASTGNESDTWLTKKTKAVMEGMLTGVAVDGVTHALVSGVKKIKALRGAKNNKEVEKILLQEDTPTVEVPEQIDTPTKTDTPQLEQTDAQPKADLPEPADVVVDVPSSSIEANNDNLLSTKAIHDIIQRTNNADEAVTEVLDSINLKRVLFESPQGSHILREMSNEMADQTLKAIGGVEPHRKVKRQATKLLADTVNEFEEAGFGGMRELVAEAGEDPQKVNALTRRLLSNRNVLNILTTQSTRLSNKISSGLATGVEKAQFAMIAKNVQEIHLAIADTKTEIGRALSALKITSTDNISPSVAKDGEDFLNKMYNVDNLSEEDALNWLMSNGWNDAQIKAMANDMKMLEGDLTGQLKHLKNMQSKPTVLGMLMEQRIMGILSGTTTQLVNVLSSSLKTISMPVERAIGGALTGDIKTIRQAGRTMVGLTMFLSESFAMASKAFKSGANILDSKHGINEVPLRQISYASLVARSKRLQAGEQFTGMAHFFATGFDYWGKIINLPARLMLTGDEFFKQMNFRADLYARLYDEAIDVAHLSKNEDISAYIANKMQEAFTETGAVAKGELTAKSLDRAQQSTWTTPLGRDSLSSWIQRGAFKHPVIRLIVPFIRTPTNIIHDFYEHSALRPFLSKDFREAIREGGERKSEAIGKLALGSMTTIAGITLATQGLITGSAPKDSKERARLYATGWKENSFKFGDTYVSYKRTDPIGIFFGLCADMVTVASDFDNITDKKNDELFYGIVASFVNNIANKTYMTGITDAIDALYSDPERYLKGYTGRMIGSFMPYSSLGRQINKELDPTTKEVRSLMDYALGSLPFYSQTLAPKYNHITGETIKPVFETSKDKNDMVLDELVRLGSGVAGAPSKSLNGVELSGEQYSRLCELHGTVKVNGKTLHQTLEAVMKSSYYDINREKYDDPPPDYHSESKRHLYAQKYILAFRKKAELELRREDKALDTTIRENQKNIHRAKAGRDIQVEEKSLLESLFN